MQNVVLVLTRRLLERGNLIVLKIGYKAVTVKFSPIGFWSYMILVSVKRELNVLCSQFPVK